jgi:hypothetical protein
LACEVRRSGSESAALYICSSSKRLGDENARQERLEGNDSREVTNAGRIAVDLMIDVGSL